MAHHSKAQRPVIAGAAPREEAVMIDALVPTAPSEESPSSSVPPSSDAERFARFAAALDALERRTKAQIGAADVRRVKRLDAFSHTMEAVGRVLIAVSPEPVSFLAGVFALFLHKQLQATEIGHTALHGAYDGLPGAERYRSKTYHWQVPIDEESWRYGHNVRHHGNTNVAGKDADIHFGPVRLTEQTPWSRGHRRQLAYTCFALFPNFAFTMNLHFTGVSDAYLGKGLPGTLDFLPDRSPESVRSAWRKALRKYVPYYALEYGLFPLLSGPFFFKVLLGNWMSETMRDVYSAATIFCGHVGPDVASYPKGSLPSSKGEWYARQMEASQNFEVPLPLSILCGGLDRQIEHHLFPRFSPQRLREIAPEVKALAEAHGVRYSTDTWPRVLGRAFAWIRQLSQDHGGVGGARAAMAEMT
jgi:fatty acid desaturase